LIMFYGYQVCVFQPGMRAGFNEMILLWRIYLHGCVFYYV